MMLAQLMNLPVKFFLGEAIEIQDKYKDKEKTRENILKMQDEKELVIKNFDN